MNLDPIDYVVFLFNSLRISRIISFSINTETALSLAAVY